MRKGHYRPSPSVYHSFPSVSSIRPYAACTYRRPQRGQQRLRKQLPHRAQTQPAVLGRPTISAWSGHPPSHTARGNKAIFRSGGRRPRWRFCPDVCTLRPGFSGKRYGPPAKLITGQHIGKTMEGPAKNVVGKLHAVIKANIILNFTVVSHHHMGPHKHFDQCCADLRRRADMGKVPDLCPGATITAPHPLSACAQKAGSLRQCAASLFIFFIIFIHFCPHKSINVNIIALWEIIVNKRTGTNSHKSARPSNTD